MKVKRPNAVLYFIAFVLLYPLMKFLFRIEHNNKSFAPPEGPFIVVANHSTIVDFMFVLLLLFPRRLNAVTATKYFLTRPLDKLLPIMGCIPKNQFSPDTRSIIDIKTVLKSGGCVLLFPEGRCSADGSFAGMHIATGKLIQHLGVPVISCFIDGAYTLMPPWRKGLRRGRVRITMSEIFSSEDLKVMSVDDINSAICFSLSGSDKSLPDKPPCTFSARRLAEGLHKILYWCPGCGSELTIETVGNTIRCSACRSAATMDKLANLCPEPGCVFPETIRRWYAEQTRYLSQSLDEDMEPIIEKVTVSLTKENAIGGEAVSGFGTLRLDSSGWHFDGQLAGEQVCHFFPVESVPALPFDHDSNFQIYSNGGIYRFTPEDARKSAKYALLGECAHRRFSSRPMLTPRVNSEFGIRNSE